jgi:hypothetical protein
LAPLTLASAIALSLFFHGYSKGEQSPSPVHLAWEPAGETWSARYGTALVVDPQLLPAGLPAGLFARYFHDDYAPADAMRIIELGFQWGDVVLHPVPGDKNRRPDEPITRFQRDAVLPFGAQLKMLRLTKTF